MGSAEARRGPKSVGLRGDYNFGLSTHYIGYLLVVFVFFFLFKTNELILRIRLTRAGNCGSYLPLYITFPL